MTVSRKRSEQIQQMLTLYENQCRSAPRSHFYATVSCVVIHKMYMLFHLKYFSSANALEVRKMKRSKEKNIMFAAVVLLSAAMVMMPAASAGATVVREGAIWYNGELYGTVVTPAMLPDKGPFDTLYVFDENQFPGQRLVSNAAPGDPDYNGGRWHVHLVTNIDYAGEELKSAHMVMEAYNNGHIEITPKDVRFVCPMIKLNS